VARFGADLIFCPCRVRSLRAMLRQKPDLPIVVVSRLPETTEWLDAIEAGACDYCAPPFEPRQVQWILDSVFKHRPAPLVPRAATSQSEGAE
jgi:DNA-binding response OmpR family regulator